MSMLAIRLFFALVAFGRVKAAITTKKMVRVRNSNRSKRKQRKHCKRPCLWDIHGDYSTIDSRHYIPQSVYSAVVLRLSIGKFV